MALGLLALPSLCSALAVVGRLPRRELLAAGTTALALGPSLPAVATAPARTLGPAGGAISGGLLPLTVGLGTCLVRLDDAARTVGIGIDAGYRCFDTAQRYGNEAGVGKGVRQAMAAGKVSRDELFVGTKVWVDNMGAGKTARSVEQSAKELGLAYIDQVLIHWPGQFVKRGSGNDAGNAALRRETWQELESLQRAGLVRSIGVSNFSERHLRELLGFAKRRPAVNQFEVHPYNQRAELVALCEREGVAVNSYCPLGGRGNKGQVTDQLLKDPTLKAMGATRGKTAAQVILRWHLQRGLTPIPKGSSKAHLVENYNVFDFELSAREMDTVASLNRDQFALFDADALA